MPSILLAVICTVAFSSFFFKQIHLANRQKHLEEDYQATISSPPADLMAVLNHLHPDYNQRVALVGIPLNDQQFLLKNQRNHFGSNGIEVITPVSIHQAVVLVDRGFLPWRSSLGKKPVLDPLPSPWLVKGLVFYPPDTLGIEKAKDAPPVFFQTDRSPRWLNRLDFLALANYFQHPIPHVTILLDADAANGFQRSWQPKAPTSIEAYHMAVPWGVFGVLSLSYCVFWAYQNYLIRKQQEVKSELEAEKQKE